MQTLIIGYCRKSSESDERQVQSIDSQKKWINSQNNNVLRIFFDEKTGKDPYVRDDFQKMIQQIEKTKNKEVIIYAWGLDRLSRNPVDSGLLQYLMQKGKLHQIITYDRTYRPEDSGMIMSLINAMNNQFILDMIKNVNRGLKDKVEKGGAIQNAPIGYVNNKATKEIDIDPKNAPYIKEIYNLRVSGYSFNEIAEKMNKRGMRGKMGGKISKTNIEHIIKNPFYIGLQKFKGKLYNSIHKKLISVKTWEKVNEVKRGYKKHNSEVEFPFKGIIKSWHTKKPLLALWKKKKYVYYSNNSKDEFTINLNQNHLIKAFDNIIEQYVIPKEYLPFVLENIKSEFDNFYSDLKERKKGLKLNLTSLNKKSDRLFDLVCKGTISDEKYKSEVNEIELEKQNILENMEAIGDLDYKIIDETNKVVELLTNLELKWKTADGVQKSHIIKMIVVELFVDTKKQLYIQENELFEYVKTLKRYNWQGLLELHQRLLASETKHSSN